MPKIVSARPVATWFASSESVSTPNASAIRSAGERAGGDAEPGAAGGHGDREGGHRAGQHHALDAEVEHARLLDHELAERGVEQAASRR